MTRKKKPHKKKSDHLVIRVGRSDVDRFRNWALAYAKSFRPSGFYHIDNRPSDTQAFRTAVDLLIAHHMPPPPEPENDWNYQ